MNVQGTRAGDAGGQHGEVCSSSLTLWQHDSLGSETCMPAHTGAAANLLNSSIGTRPLPSGTAVQGECTLDTGWFPSVGSFFTNLAWSGLCVGVSEVRRGRLRRGRRPDGQLLRREQLRQHEQPGLLLAGYTRTAAADPVPRPNAERRGHQPRRHRVLERQRHRRSLRRAPARASGAADGNQTVQWNAAATSTAAGTELGTRRRASMPVQRRAKRPLACGPASRPSSTVVRASSASSMVVFAVSSCSGVCTRTRLAPSAARVSPEDPNAGRGGGATPGNPSLPCGMNAAHPAAPPFRAPPRPIRPPSSTRSSSRRRRSARAKRISSGEGPHGQRDRPLPAHGHRRPHGIVVAADPLEGRQRQRARTAHDHRVRSRQRGHLGAGSALRGHGLQADVHRQPSSSASARTPGPTSSSTPRSSGSSAPRPTPTGSGAPRLLPVPKPFKPALLHLDLRRRRDRDDPDARSSSTITRAARRTASTRTSWWA